MSKEQTMTAAYRVVVDIDGTEASAVVDGPRHFIRSTNPNYISRITSAADRRVADVALIRGEPHNLFKAGWDDPVALTAALFSIAPGLTTVVEAPSEVWAVLGGKPNLTTVVSIGSEIR